MDVYGMMKRAFEETVGPATRSPRGDVNHLDIAGLHAKIDSVDAKVVSLRTEILAMKNELLAEICRLTLEIRQRS